MREYIQIRISNISGKGVFAAKDFRPGERICTFKGKPETLANAQRRYGRGDRRVTCDTFQTGLRSYINLDKLYNSINHSCDPNAGINGSRTLVAIKPIPAGTEITFDYSSTEWTPQDYTVYNKNQWPLPCDCGSRYCRKLVTCFPYLPAAAKRKYLKGGIIQNFILKKLKLPKQLQRCYVCEDKLNNLRRV